MARRGTRVSTVSPMLARSASEPPSGDQWVYEAKYDGVRVLAYAASASVSLVSRNGNEKCAQFPEIVEALRALSARAGAPLVLDGEIVALVDGELGRFQDLQGRIHTSARETIRAMKSAPAVFVAFDLLLVGEESLVSEPYTERRRRLAKLFGRRKQGVILLAESLAMSGAKALAHARARGWEGVVAKRRDAPYQLGQRTGAWVKIKAEEQQEFVIGGYTEPRNSREHIGALLVGVYDEAGQFVFAGAVGTGFTQKTLADLHARLKPLERKTPAFVNPPRTREKAHWVRPSLVAEVRFNEWTADAVLRHPVYLGLRDDKSPRDVRRESAPRQSGRVVQATRAHEPLQRRDDPWATAMRRPDRLGELARGTR